MAELRTVRIGGLGRVVTGKTPPSSQPKLFGELYPFLTPTDIDGVARYVETGRFLSSEGRDYQHRLMLPERAVCVVCIGATIGKVCMTSRPSFTNQQINSVVVNEDEHDPFFVYHLFRTLRDELRANAGGAATPIINKTAFSEIEVKVPPLSVQRRVASILSAYDELIENNHRRMQILEQMARALYREWFVEFRSPGVISEQFVELETGRAPAEWKAGRLEGFLDVLETGNRPNGGVGEYTKGVPSVGAESIVGVGQFDFSKTKFVPRDYFASMRSGIVEDRDVLVYKDGGRPGIFIPHVTLFGSGFPFEEMAINSHVYRLRARRGISQEYLYFYLSSEAVLHWMHMHGTGAAVPSLARDDLKQLPFVQPEPETLGRFDHFVQPLVSEILLLARQSRNLQCARDLSLPRLLSGQIAVDGAAA